MNGLTRIDADIYLQVQVLIWDQEYEGFQKKANTPSIGFWTGTEKRLGKIDAVLIWHVYPNLGVDDRNQFDLLQDLPGGLPGLRHLVEQFHAHGVRVFFPFLFAWDTGTREQNNIAIAISQELKEIGADGIS